MIVVFQCGLIAQRIKKPIKKRGGKEMAVNVIIRRDIQGRVDSLIREKTFYELFENFGPV